MARAAAEARLGEIERAVLDRDATIKELEQSRATFAEQNDALAATVTAREQAYNRVQEKLFAHDELVKLVESQLGAARQQAELQIEELNSELQREQLERTIAEGALEAGRKDIARLLRELAASHYRPPAYANDTADPPPRLRALPARPDPAPIAATKKGRPCGRRFHCQAVVRHRAGANANPAACPNSGHARTSVEVTIQLMDAGDRGDRQ